MPGLVLLLMGLLSGAGVSEYARSLTAKKLDQATLDAESYGEKGSLKREDDGLRITVGPGEKETGWKTPPQLRFGGDFTISANLAIKKLAKPAQEDGAAVGLAIAFQDVNQPDATLVRLIEPDGTDVYRSIERAPNNPSGPGGPRPFPQPGGKPVKPPRPTFPAAGDVVRMELQREGNTVRFQVLDVKSSRSRYLGQVQLGSNDVAAVKLFVSNRNGAEAVNVLFRDLTIRANHINGLGTVVRTVFDELVYADPTAIENGVLVVGGPPKAPPPTKPKVPEKKDAGGSTTAQKGAGQLEGGSKETKKTGEESSKKPAETKKEAVQPAAAKQVANDSTKARAATPAPPPKPPEPKAKISLDEVESIHFERSPALAARFMGQPNLDFTMPGLSAKKDGTGAKTEAKVEAKKDAKAEAKGEAKKDGAGAKTEAKGEAKKEGTGAKTEAKGEAKKEGAGAKTEAKKAAVSDDVLAPPPGTTITKIPKVDPKKNGIRDLYLSLSGLRAAQIRQITVNCPTDKGPANWRLDTSDSQDWPLVVRRSGTEACADVFLEPPPGDCFQKDFRITVNYADGQAGNANAKAGDHTHPDLVLDSKAPAVPQSDAWVYLTNEEKLFGKLERIGQDTLRLVTPWQDHLDVPLARVVGVHVGLLERKETPESFAKRLKARGSEDLLLAQTKNGEVLAIAGVVEGSEVDKLRFRFQGRSRTLPLKQVEGLVMADRPDSKPTDELRPTFSLTSGAVVSGRWKDLNTSVWKIDTVWGQELNLPAAEVRDVRFRGGKMTYLSDLNPSKVEETPFFGHRLSWCRNVNLLGEPLKMSGQTYDRGVAVHSRCILTYDLNGRYAKFEVLVGFDDAVKGQGRVDCRVFADGRELYSNADLRADGPPVKLALPVAGAEQLRLMVDFGRGQDTGDRVIWANARLYRQAAGQASASTRERSPESIGAVDRR